MLKQPEISDFKVWVAGATGYTGKALVRILGDMGVTVFGHIRPDSPSKDDAISLFTAQGITPQVVPWERDALAAAMKEADVTHVFGLLGTTAKKGRQAQSEGKLVNYQTIDLGLTKMLLDACTELPSCQRFIYLSAIGVKPSSRSPYMRARWEAEEYIRSSGVPYTIAQPSLITGPDREESRPLEDVAAVLVKGLLGTVKFMGGKGVHDRYQTLNATTLAKGLIHAGLHEQGINQTLETDRIVDHASDLDQS